MLEKWIDSEVIQSVPRVLDELIPQPSEVLSELTNARLVDPVYNFSSPCAMLSAVLHRFRKSVHVAGSQI
ncbi:MAG: hypothetical protein JRN59_08850 [Nitrososphaerota archaeon]|nr:hypothetical protein [Nitrososphaerota archaeon]